MSEIGKKKKEENKKSGVKGIVLAVGGIVLTVLGAVLGGGKSQKS